MRTGILQHGSMLSGGQITVEHGGANPFGGQRRDLILLERAKWGDH